MISDDTWHALIVAVTSAISVPLMALVTMWITSRGKQEDRRREDDLAARQEKRQDEVAERLAATDEALRERAVEATIRLENLRKGQKEIHTLVNSQMTVTMQSDLDTTEALLAALTEIVKLQRASGHEPTVTSLAVIEATEIKIAQLRIALHERKKLADAMPSAAPVVQTVAKEMAEARTGEAAATASADAQVRQAVAQERTADAAEALTMKTTKR